MHGAIFTTTPDGAIVNENVHYNKKIEVYLDGGPGPNAPKTAASLPDGKYYFQVTDPSGKVLLSEDPAKCRMFVVEDGVIVSLAIPDGYTDGYTLYDKKGNPIPVPNCHIQEEPDGVAGPSGRHDTNTDTDHGGNVPDGDNAIVVQLMPFFDTPNNGGVYKAWVITEAQYIANGGDPDAVPAPQHATKGNKQIGYDRDDGFGPSRNNVKTDNFKVKVGGKPCPKTLTVKKFYDADFDGVQDADEVEISGWPVQIIDPVATNDYFTEVEVMTEVQGIWTVIEDDTGAVQTVAILDNVVVSQLPSVSPAVDVTVAGTCDEHHTVVFGNSCTGHIKACKYYDLNRNGAADAGEEPIEGWKMHLTGTDVTGQPVDEELFTGADGCVSFPVLPGSYTVEEMIPTTNGWETADETSKDVVITGAVDVDNAKIVCTEALVDFANYCTGTADFGTKGYWHNKNGLGELSFDPDIIYVNGLAPYSTPSSYFDAGDEPFDGKFEDGTCVAASKGVLDDEEIAAACLWKAEVSQFLVENNANSSLEDHKQQLAQQLLAFIFNVQHRLYGPGAMIYDGTNWISAQSLIDDAIAAWLSGVDVTETQEKLAAFNESDAVLFVAGSPCNVSYPTP